MTQAEALRLAAYIAGAYRNSDSSNGALAVLADQLTDLDHDRAKGVVREIVAAGGPFAPSAGEIRNAYFANLYRIPSVAAIVYEVSENAGCVLTAGKWDSLLAREVALEVGQDRLATDWNFAHREVVAVAERLREEVLRKVNLASLNGYNPEFPFQLALAVHGLDYYEKPKPPALPEGWVWHGWNREGACWNGTAFGPAVNGANLPDSRHYTVGMMYEDVDPDTLALPGGQAWAPALPAGGWSAPEPTFTEHRRRYAEPWRPNPKPSQPKVNPQGTRSGPSTIADGLDAFLATLPGAKPKPPAPDTPP